MKINWKQIGICYYYIDLAKHKNINFSSMFDIVQFLAEET